MSSCRFGSSSSGPRYLLVLAVAGAVFVLGLLTGARQPHLASREWWEAKARAVAGPKVVDEDNRPIPPSIVNT